MITLMSKCSTCQYVAFHKETYKKVNRKVQEEPQSEAAANPRHQEEDKNFKIRKGHTESIHKFHHGSSEREREREREREKEREKERERIIMYGQWPG